MPATRPTPYAGPAAGLAFYEHVHAYADQVRTHLADLRPEQVEELTDGLEANLADAVVDAPGALPRRTAPDGQDDVALDLTALFGAADAYAAELRAAAGLAPRGTPEVRHRPGVRGGVRALGHSLAGRWLALWRPVTSTSQWAAFREFCRALTPVWWVLRGWLAASILLAVFGGYGVAPLPPDGSARLFLLALVVVSVQWGRGRWLPLSWMPRALRYVSVALVVVGVPLTWHVASTPVSAVAYSEGYQQGFDEAASFSGGQPVAYDGHAGSGADGVWVDGMQVSNLFVYDAAGDPVRDVQVFDDRGRPVRTVTADGAFQTWAVPDVDGAWYFQPALAGDGRERWNVYPLRAVEEQDVEYPDDGTGYPTPPVPATGASTHDMPWPFLKAPTAIPASGQPEKEDRSDADEESADTDTTGKPAPSPRDETPSSGTSLSPVLEADG